jgi:hypothetical protein
MLTPLPLDDPVLVNGWLKLLVAPRFGVRLNPQSALHQLCPR